MENARRDFLKHTALIGGAAVSAPLMSGSAEAAGPGQVPFVWRIRRWLKHSWC